MVIVRTAFAGDLGLAPKQVWKRMGHEDNIYWQWICFDPWLLLKFFWTF